MTSDNNNEPKMVLESDLMAVKAKLSGLESTNAELTTQLEEWKGKAATSDDAFRKAGAERDTANAKIEELTGQVVEIEGLRTELSDTKGKLETANTSILDSHRTNLKTLGIPDELLENKTAADMKLMAATLFATNHRPNSQQQPPLDGGGGGGGTGPTKGRDLIMAGVEGGLDQFTRRQGEK